MTLFEGYNPISKRRLEQDNLPSYSEIDFLQKVIDYKRQSQINQKDIDKVEEIKNNLNEIMEYNIELYDKYDCDENDYRIVQIPPHISKMVADAEQSLGIICKGGVKNYKKEVLLQQLMQQPFGGYQAREQEMMLLFPEDFNRKLKPKGNWIMVSEDVNCESAPNKYEIYYATPLAKDCTVFGMNVKRWYASIISNNKEVLLEPREYVVVPDANLLLESIGNGIEMVEGSVSARLDKNKVFYLKSRGFNQAEIYQILFKSITNKGFCHFKVDPELCDIFELIKGGHSVTMAIRVNEHMSNLPNFKFKKSC